MRSSSPSSSRVLALLAVAALTGGVLSGCASGGDEPAATSTDDAQAAVTLDELYEQVQEAGQTTVTVYGPSEAAFEPVYAEFVKAFPDMDVATEFLFGGDLRTRVDQEIATGQQVGDLIHLDDAVNYLDDLQAVDVVGMDEVPADVSLLDGKLVVPSRSLYTMVYNTDKLSEADIPQAWADVTDSTELAGAMGMSDPTSLAATATVLYSAYENDAIDDDWLTAVAGMSPQVYQSTSQMVGALATGEIAFTPVAYYGFVVTQQAKGAKLDYVIPEDGVVLADNPYALLDGAPSPLGAQLLLSWLLSEDGQAAIASLAFEYGAVEGSPAPDGLPAVDELTVFPAPPAGERAQFKQDAVDLLKTFF